MSRIIIFTGKGGVGKTMVSTAHAVASADEGKKTLLVSTDMAHNLGDILGQRIGSSVKHVNEHLDAVELDPDLIMRNDFPDFMRSYEALLKSAGVEPEEQDQFTVIPGMENLFSLMKIRQFYESGDYERIIVDCAPSGETISMLKLPELLSWYFEKLFPVGRMAIRILSPFSKVFMKVEMPDQEALSDVEKLYKTMLEIQDLIKDSEVTTVRLVCTPEKMVVDETKRSFMYLNLYHYQVDGLYINRVIPELEGNAFMSKWHQIQAGYIEELERVFTQIPITKIPWYPDEIRGMDSVEHFCRENFSPETIDEAFSVRVRTENEVYVDTRDGYKLRLALPFAQADEVEVSGMGSDLEVHVGSYHRTIPLPNSLRNNTILGSKFEDGYLEVEFFADKGGVRR